MPAKSGRSSQSGTGKKRGAKATSKTAKRGSAAAGPKADSKDVLGDDAARLALRESDKLYYRIGEVSRLTGVKAHVLRYWETEFRWMAPPKSRSKQRLYRKRDIELVWLLKRLLWDERYTIAGARQRIQELGVDGALALLDQDPSAEPTQAEAVATAKDSASAATSPAADAAQLPEGSQAAPSQAAWVSFRAALDEMRGELVTLKSALQDGA